MNYNVIEGGERPLTTTSNHERSRELELLVCPSPRPCLTITLSSSMRKGFLLSKRDLSNANNNDAPSLSEPKPLMKDVDGGNRSASTTRRMKQPPPAMIKRGFLLNQSTPDSSSRRSSSTFNDLPRHIAASFILPYILSSDWLRFRAASRGCYQTVHGSANDVVVSHFFCPKCRPHAPTSMQCTSTTVVPSSSSNEILSQNLWKLALIRDFLFQETDGDENQDLKLMHRTFHSPIEPVSDALVSTQNMFTASNLFVSWMHWRKLSLRLNSW
jgi:hypothetical protein